MVLNAEFETSNLERLNSASLNKMPEFLFGFGRKRRLAQPKHRSALIDEPDEDSLIVFVRSGYWSKAACTWRTIS
jgi:hypothetical protein